MTTSPTAGAEDPRPEMTQRDANFQVHLAGQRAAEQAANAGADPQLADALLDAAAGGRLIGGVRFPPIHASLLLLLPKLDGFKAKFPDLANDSIGLMAIAHCVLDPDNARSAIMRADVAAFEAALYEISTKLTLPQLRELGEWIAAQLKLLNGEPPAEPEDMKKKSPAELA